MSFRASKHWAILKGKPPFFEISNPFLYLSIATSKSFLIPNKLKPGYMLRHGSLEGPEHGVYHRGKLNGSGIIELPEYWEWLVDEDTITVQITPIGEFQKYVIKSISTTQIEISNLDGTDNVNCFYIIHGERKDIDKMIVDEKI